MDVPVAANVLGTLGAVHECSNPIYKCSKADFYGRFVGLFK